MASVDLDRYPASRRDYMPTNRRQCMSKPKVTTSFTLDEDVVELLKRRVKERKENEGLDLSNSQVLEQLIRREFDK